MNKVGNLLKQKREEKNLSIDDVVKALKIQKPYLEAIESGDYTFFKNQEFYQQVFVSSYANFLGLDKNEILKDLINDNKQALEKIKNQPQQEMVEPKQENIEQDQLESDTQEILNVDGEKDAESKPEVEIQQEIVETESKPETNPVVEDESLKVEEKTSEEVPELVEEDKASLEATRPLNSFLEGLRQANKNAQDNPLAEKGLPPKNVEEVENIEEEKDNEITQILNSLQKNHVSPLSKVIDNKDTVKVISDNEGHADEIISEQTPSEDASFDKKINEEEPIDNKASEEETVDNEVSEEETIDNQVGVNSLNTSLRDQINLLNESDVKKDELSQEDVSVPDHLKDEGLQSTAVIDLTSGISLEKIPDELKDTFNQDVKEIREQDAEGEEYADSVSNLDPKDEKVVGLDDLEKNINSAKDMNLINEDPDKTSMNLKIAKALGDSKMVLDEETSKKIKRERVVNGILIALIIILIIVLIYQLVLSR